MDRLCRVENRKSESRKEGSARTSFLVLKKKNEKSEKNHFSSKFRAKKASVSLLLLSVSPAPSPSPESLSEST